MFLCFLGFGCARLERVGIARGIYLVAACIAFFGLLTLLTRDELWLEGRITGTKGPPGVLSNWWLVHPLLGTLLLGAAHNAMALGHWYLISRNLSFAYLIRITQWLLVLLGVRTAYMILLLGGLRCYYPAESYEFVSQLFSTNGNLMFFVMRVLWGLVLPFALAFMSWRCAVGKANQAATGLLYLCEVSVLFGELFAAYLMI